MRKFIVRPHLTVALALLLLVPLGGAAVGRTVTASDSKACEAALLAHSDVPSAFCVFDQAGNQYSFSRDLTDPQGNYLLGTVTNNQGCASTTWYLLGSFVRSGGTKLELTAVNPLGDHDPNCVPTYKLKGTYPNMAWYYTFGYGDQEFAFTSCATGQKPAGPVTSGGARRSPGR